MALVRGRGASYHPNRVIHVIVNPGIMSFGDRHAALAVI